MLVEGDEGEAYLEGTMTRGESSRFRLMKGNDVLTDETRSPIADYTESFYRFERECVDSMLYGQSVTQSAAENLKTLTCTFAAYAAAEQGTIVRLADFYKQHGLSSYSGPLTPTTVDKR